MEQLTKTDISKYTHTTEQVQSHSFADTFVNIVPTNIMKSLADGDMLAIIFFSVLFGLGVAQLVKEEDQFFNFSKVWLTQCFT